MKRGKPMKRDTGPIRVWKEAVVKRDEEGRCRVCGSNQNVQIAHTIGRENDIEIDRANGRRVLWVDPNDTVPLCGPFANDCHGKYDGRRLDLLPYLTLQEQIAAVRAAGGIYSALKRLTGQKNPDIKETA